VPAASAAQGLADHVDVDALVRFAVGQTLVGDADWVRDDYWLVRPADDDARFLMVPWDKDLSFGSNFSPTLGTAHHVFDLEWDLHGPLLGNNPLTRIALADPGWREAFHEELGVALEGIFSTASLCEELAAVAPVVEDRGDRRRGDGGEPDGFHWNPQQHWAEPGHADLHLSTVIDYAQRRAAFLRAQIALAGEGLLGSPRTEGPMAATVEIGAADAGTSVLTAAHPWAPVRAMTPCRPEAWVRSGM
jgi:spore coat protein H